MGRHAERCFFKTAEAAALTVSPIRVRVPKRPLGPRKMLKNGLHRVTANHGNLTHLIFVLPRSVVIDSK
jgi:hypothetical protein